MKRITIKDLTERLNGWESSTIQSEIETSEVVLLEETIWGLESGVYRPLGELQLPMQYENAQPSGENFREYNLLSIFTHDFFDGVACKDKDAGYLTPLNIVVQRNIKERSYVYGEGFSDAISAKKVVQDFLEDFFKQYQDLANVENAETRECLQRSFIKYS